MITLGEIVLIHDLKRQGLSVTAIARQLGIDRKTVRKHLVAGLAAPSYAPRPAQPRLIAPYEDGCRAEPTSTAGADRCPGHTLIGCGSTFFLIQLRFFKLLTL